MKRLIISFSVIFLILSSFACQNKNKPIQPQTESEIVVSEDIVMTGYPTSLNSLTDTIKVTITNNTKLEATTGAYYEIERYVEQPDIASWQKVPLELAFHDIAFIIQPRGSSKEFSILLHPELYKYEPGKYRVTKKATTEKGNYELFFVFELNIY